jgi:integrase/recombinase XerD
MGAAVIGIDLGGTSFPRRFAKADSASRGVKRTDLLRDGGASRSAHPAGRALETRELRGVGIGTTLQAAPELLALAAPAPRARRRNDRVTALAPTLQAYFTDRLLCQRRVSPNTVASYRDAFRLLLGFAHEKTGTSPARLELTQLDAPMIGAFLEHLERERGNSARTRNIRLAAVHSFFHYCALRHPEHAALIQRVLAIPPKRSEKRTITYLTPDEVRALLDSPDRTTWAGRHDHALLLTAVQTGLRVSEVLALTRPDAHLGAGPHVRAIGKGRKERVAPLTRHTVAVLRVWIRESADEPGGPLFPRATAGHSPATGSSVGSPSTSPPRSATARPCALKRVSMHVLRHTAAMTLLHAGIDTSTIALWLGHEQERTTHGYLHAELALKQRTLDRITPPNGRPGRYRAPDTLLAFLEGL